MIARQGFWRIALCKLFGIEQFMHGYAGNSGIKKAAYRAALHLQKRIIYLIKSFTIASTADIVKGSSNASVAALAVVEQLQFVLMHRHN